MMILAPSILAADFKELGKEIRTIEENGAQYLHFDVMDGMFVPSISFGVPVLESIRPATKLVCDAHLMVTEPIRYVEAFAKAGRISSRYTWRLVRTSMRQLKRLEHADVKWAFRSVRYTGDFSERSAEESRHDSDHVCTSRVWRSGIYSGIIG